MSTAIQVEANRQNALQSSGPRTAEGIEPARFNAVRHGLRSLQMVIPGEDHEAWDAHRARIVEDLKPADALERGPRRLCAILSRHSPDIGRFYPHSVTDKRFVPCRSRFSGDRSRPKLELSIQIPRSRGYGSSTADPCTALESDPT